jgi:hypothetical protein
MVNMFPIKVIYSRLKDCIGTNKLVFVNNRKKKQNSDFLIVRSELFLSPTTIQEWVAFRIEDYHLNYGIHFYILFMVIMCTIEFSVSQVKVCAFYDLSQSMILFQPCSNIC